MSSRRTSTPISNNYSQDDIGSLHAQFKASVKRNLPKRKVNSAFEVRYDTGTGERITTSRKRPHKRRLEANSRQENRNH